MERDPPESTFPTSALQRILTNTPTVFYGCFRTWAFFSGTWCVFSLGSVGGLGVCEHSKRAQIRTKTIAPRLSGRSLEV